MLYMRAPAAGTEATEDDNGHIWESESISGRASRLRRAEQKGVRDVWIEGISVQIPPYRRYIRQQRSGAPEQGNRPVAEEESTICLGEEIRKASARERRSERRIQGRIREKLPVRRRDGREELQQMQDQESRTGPADVLALPDSGTREAGKKEKDKGNRRREETKEATGRIAG